MKSKVIGTLLAGGGVKGGLVYGASDATASEPKDKPVSPENLATTMYHLLGIVEEMKDLRQVVADAGNEQQGLEDE